LSYLTPRDVIASLADAGVAKLATPIPTLLLRSALAGGILALAVVLAVRTSIQTGLGITGALVFPAGFCILVLLGLDLVTGNFAVVALARLRDGKPAASELLAHWSWAFLGNLAGSLVLAGLVAISLTMGFAEAGSPEGERLAGIATTKTLGYAEHGGRGLLTVFTRAVLCNWMVTLGVVMAFTSSSVGGKIFAMWLPIALFFALGFEHAVVNMFVIPLGMMLGAPVDLLDWWLWNQIPVTLGNLVGGLVPTALALHLVHGARRSASREPRAVELGLENAEALAGSASD